MYKIINMAYTKQDIALIIKGLELTGMEIEADLFIILQKLK